MAVDRVDGDVELARDLGSGQICRQIPQDAQLAWAQLLRWRQELFLGGRPRGPSQPVGEVAKQAAVSRFMTRERVEQLSGPDHCKWEDQPVWLGGCERRTLAGRGWVGQGWTGPLGPRSRRNDCKMANAVVLVKTST